MGKNTIRQTAHVFFIGECVVPYETRLPTHTVINEWIREHGVFRAFVDTIPSFGWELSYSSNNFTDTGTSHKVWIHISDPTSAVMMKMVFENISIS